MIGIFDPLLDGRGWFSPLITPDGWFEADLIQPTGGGTAHQVFPADSVTPSDALVFDRGLLVADSVTPSDALTFQRQIVVADTLSLADAISMGPGLGISDSVTLSDAVSIGFGVGISDSVTLSDALTFVRELLIADTVSLADAITFVREILIADTLSLADNVTAERGLNVFINDFLSRNQIISIVIFDVAGPPTNSGNFTITFKGQTTVGIDCTAQNAATTQAALEGLSNIDPGDVTVTNDTLGSVGGQPEQTHQLIEFTGQWAKQRLIPGVDLILNNGTMTDGGTQVGNFQQGTSGVDDLFTFETGKGVSIDDTLSISDALTFDRGVGIADAVTPSDALTFDRSLAIADAVTIVDAIAKEQGLSIADVLSLADDVLVELNPGAGAAVATLRMLMGMGQ